MKKVLWLSNLAFSNISLKSTGGWLQPLAESLQRSNEIAIVNVTFGDVKESSVENLNSGIVQWIIPRRRHNKGGLKANNLVCKDVSAIIDNEKPDIVHIWGTESLWASIYYQGYIHVKTILDIQGLINAYVPYYYGALTFKERLQTLSLRELIDPRKSIFMNKLGFFIHGLYEKKYLKAFENISVQSSWVEAYMNVQAPKAKLYHTGIILRDVFYKAKPWEYKEFGISPTIFTTSAGATSYKGIHILIKALAIIKNVFPKCTLRIAGNFISNNKSQVGYTRFILFLIKKLGLKENVIFLGPIDKDKIVKELQNADLTVIPSFVETYCLALAESLMIGTPTVASYAGAMPEQAFDGKEALFYESTNYFSLAERMEAILENKELAKTLSVNSRARKLIDNNVNKIVFNQLQIYKSLLGTNNL